MKTIKTYKQFKESLVIDLMMSSVDILESMNIWHDVLLSSIGAEQVDIFQTLSLPEEFREKLDIDFQKALESGTDTTAIVAEKQRLRDITKLADTATTLEELKALEVKP